MKVLTIILMFVAAACYAGDASDITSRVFEKTNANGTVSFRKIWTYRGGDKVMTETFQTNAQGVLTLNFRCYYAGGNLVMTECDEHESGRLDTISIFTPGTDATEVFTRQADGSVKPVSTRKLWGYKQLDAVNADFFKTLNNTNTTDAQWAEKVQETKQKVKEIERKMEDAEKPKTDGKQ